MIGLRDVCGLWRRTLIAWPDGSSDSDAAVFWLQGPRHYADLRIPAGRPARPDIVCLRDLDWTMLRFMARQEGFFGRFDIVDGVGQWHRVFDYRPDTGVADRGALCFEGDVLVERGVEQPYVEHWSRQSVGDDAMALMLTAETGAPGCLVAAGDAFIYACGRTVALPPGGTLDDLIDGAASLQAAQDLFDCEISFGSRAGGTWRIDRSSHCFREGAALSPAADAAAMVLTVDDVTSEGIPFRRTWRIAGYESAIATPPSHWFSRPAVTSKDLPEKSMALSSFGQEARYAAYDG